MAERVITVDDIIRAGACIDGVRRAVERLSDRIAAAMPVSEVLMLVDQGEHKHVMRAAGLDGYGVGSGYGYGVGSGDGEGDGDGYGNGSGDGYGDGCGDSYGNGRGDGFGDGCGDGYGDGYGGRDSFDCWGDAAMEGE